MKQYVVYFKLGDFPNLFNISISANNFKEALNFVRENIYGRYKILEFREVKNMNTDYIKMIRSTIRTALKMRLNYYEFNWYLLGTKNGYRYTNKLPSTQEIDYADRLIDKVSDALLMKGVI